MKYLTTSHEDLRGRTVLLRVDMNCPIKDGRIHGKRRIIEAAENLQYLKESRAVVITHQGRVGNDEYVELDGHADILSANCGRPVRYVRDVMGDAAIDAIRSMKNGDIILLDNLRFYAEENYDYKSNADGASSMVVRRLSPHLDACVLDAFPCAHRRHPSITGFAYAGVDAYAGVITGRELTNLSRIMSIAKAPHVVVFGGSKIDDRLYAMDRLLNGGRADHILLTGQVGCLFLYAQARLDASMVSKEITSNHGLVKRAHILMDKYPGKLHTPVDVAVNTGDGRRMDVDVRFARGFTIGDDAGPKNMQIHDIGPNTVEFYSKWISSAGTVFISGPAGRFEHECFAIGTRSILQAAADSAATTIISGGHLTTALVNMGLTDKINHVSTAGGALVLYMTGAVLPMVEALNWRQKDEMCVMRT
ncbi:MAG: phosphoglycerate kinase [Cenarchaeum sp. SB0661_bin_35]|nr:phosphoglycerate kinase [Cenarchaeum sp. SB0667_bin_13]MYC79166.1 phosphoglycerate kinase [Cenarchaeum sp. SB0661_bin_35]MYI52084.1 phosphoglycerate kinase [Cenarchaeum sp. SB0673_bin_9]